MNNVYELLEKINKEIKLEHLKSGIDYTLLFIPHVKDQKVIMSKNGQDPSPFTPVNKVISALREREKS